MKIILTSFLILTIGIEFSNAQNCSSLYTYTAVSDTLSFSNSSFALNAHYYWNFGDGSGSNDKNPVHVFPDNGDYLVTLYSRDTVSNCTAVFESWIPVTKKDTLSCHILMTDSIESYDNDDFLILNNESTNCGWLNFNCEVGGPGQNYCNPLLDDGWGSALFLGGIDAYTDDTVNAFRIYKEYFKTVPYNYSSAVNYQNCSSNFEVTINYQPAGALVNLNAMNKSGIDTFLITGFGNPIALVGHSASYLYPYITYSKHFPWLIAYQKTDAGNGCRVLGSQQILINNPGYAFPVSCAISYQSQNQMVQPGSNAQFVINADTGVSKQWQQDAGLGFVNLTNAGPYSGVHTDTLSIAAVTQTMNNYNYRCVVSSQCHNTSEPVVLTVGTAGVNEIELKKIDIYPNPAINRLVIRTGQLNVEGLEVTDMPGRLLINETVKVQSDLTLDISDLAQGVYFVTIHSSAGNTVRKFVKQ